MLLISMNVDIVVKCKHSFSNLFDQYYCDKTDENGEEYDLEADKDCGGVYYDANGLAMHRKAWHNV